MNYCEVFHSVPSLVLITSSVLQTNSHYMFATYRHFFFTKSLLHVSVSYAPTSERTSYVCSKLSTIYDFVSYFIKYKIYHFFVD